MKAVISGPRSNLTADLHLPFMHIELELEELPKRGDVIILNSGSPYYVTNIMWWVDGPENEAYWSHGDYRTDAGRYQVVHITVEPDNRRKNYGYPAGLEDGKVQGGDQFLTELRELVCLAQDAGIEGGLTIIDTWLARKERASADRKAAEAEQERRAAEVIRASYEAAEQEQEKRS
jgi:hypothetical protein